METSRGGDVEEGRSGEAAAPEDWTGCNSSESGLIQLSIGVCAMRVKTQSKPMRAILSRLERAKEFHIVVFDEQMILEEDITAWPRVDCLIAFYSTGFPLDKALAYAKRFRPILLNDLEQQKIIRDRVQVYEQLKKHGIPHPPYVVVDYERVSRGEAHFEEGYDYIVFNNKRLNKPFIEKPRDADNHDNWIYYPKNTGGGCKKLYRKQQNSSSSYCPDVHHVRKDGTYIYEEFLSTFGTDVKVYTVGPLFAHAEARKSPSVDGVVCRSPDGKEVRYPVILTEQEKWIAYRLVRAFQQIICGFDILRTSSGPFVCDVNGFSFVKGNVKYYEDCANILRLFFIKKSIERWSAFGLPPHVSALPALESAAAPATASPSLLLHSAASGASPPLDAVLQQLLRARNTYRVLRQTTREEEKKRESERGKVAAATPAGKPAEAAALAASAGLSEGASASTPADARVPGGAEAAADSAAAALQGDRERREGGGGEASLPPAPARAPLTAAQPAASPVSGARSPAAGASVSGAASDRRRGGGAVGGGGGEGETLEACEPSQDGCVSPSMASSFALHASLLERGGAQTRAASISRYTTAGESSGDEDEELRTVVVVMRHGDRKPKQKLKFQTAQDLILDLFEDERNPRKEIKLKSPEELRDLLDRNTEIITSLGQALFAEKKSLEDEQAALKPPSLLESPLPGAAASPAGEAAAPASQQDASSPPAEAQTKEAEATEAERARERQRLETAVEQRQSAIAKLQKELSVHKLLQKVLLQGDGFAGINRKIQLKPVAWEERVSASPRAAAAAGDSRRGSRGEESPPQASRSVSAAEVTQLRSNTASSLPDSLFSSSSSSPPSPPPPAAAAGGAVGRVTRCLVVAKWGGELTGIGRKQAEDLGKKFRYKLYPGDSAGLLRLHSTFRHDFKIYTSDEGRCQVTSAAFTKGFLDLEGELTPILVALVIRNNKAHALLDDTIQLPERKECKEVLDELLNLNISFRDATDDQLALVDALFRYPLQPVQLACLKEVDNPWQAMHDAYQGIQSFVAAVEVPTTPEGASSRTAASEKKGEASSSSSSSAPSPPASSAAGSGGGKEKLLEHPYAQKIANIKQRWTTLLKDWFDPRTGLFDTSKIADVMDMLRYELIHHRHLTPRALALAVETHNKMLPIHTFSGPAESGITAKQKLRIGAQIVGKLVKKIVRDLTFFRSDGRPRLPLESTTSWSAFTDWGRSMTAAAAAARFAPPPETSPAPSPLPAPPAAAAAPATAVASTSVLPPSAAEAFASAQIAQPHAASLVSAAAASSPPPAPPASAALPHAPSPAAAPTGGGGETVSFLGLGSGPAVAASSPPSSFTMSPLSVGGEGAAAAQGGVDKTRCVSSATPSHGLSSFSSSSVSPRDGDRDRAPRTRANSATPSGFSAALAPSDSEPRPQHRPSSLCAGLMPGAASAPQRVLSVAFERLRDRMLTAPAAPASPRDAGSLVLSSAASSPPRARPESPASPAGEPRLGLCGDGLVTAADYAYPPKEGLAMSIAEPEPRAVGTASPAASDYLEALPRANSLACGDAPHSHLALQNLGDNERFLQSLSLAKSDLFLKDEGGARASKDVPDAVAAAADAAAEAAPTASAPFRELVQAMCEDDEDAASPRASTEESCLPAALWGRSASSTDAFSVGASAGCARAAPSPLSADAPLAAGSALHLFSLSYSSPSSPVSSSHQPSKLAGGGDASASSAASSGASSAALVPPASTLVLHSRMPRSASSACFSFSNSAGRPTQKGTSSVRGSSTGSGASRLGGSAAATRGRNLQKGNVLASSSISRASSTRPSASSGSHGSALKKPRGEEGAAGGERLDETRKCSCGWSSDAGKVAGLPLTEKAHSLGSFKSSERGTPIGSKGAALTGGGGDDGEKRGRLSLARSCLCAEGERGIGGVGGLAEKVVINSDELWAHQKKTKKSDKREANAPSALGPRRGSDLHSVADTEAGGDAPRKAGRGGVSGATMSSSRGKEREEREGDGEKREGRRKDEEQGRCESKSALGGDGQTKDAKGGDHPGRAAKEGESGAAVDTKLEKRGSSATERSKAGEDGAAKERTGVDKPGEEGDESKVAQRRKSGGRGGEGEGDENGNAEANNAQGDKHREEDDDDDHEDHEDDDPHEHEVTAQIRLKEEEARMFGIRSPWRIVRSRYYVTSASHVQALLNILLFSYDVICVDGVCASCARGGADDEDKRHGKASQEREKKREASEDSKRETRRGLPAAKRADTSSGETKAADASAHATDGAEAAEKADADAEKSDNASERAQKAAESQKRPCCAACAEPLLDPGTNNELVGTCDLHYLSHIVFRVWERKRHRRVPRASPSPLSSSYSPSASAFPSSPLSLSGASPQAGAQPPAREDRNDEDSLFARSPSSSVSSTVADSPAASPYRLEISFSTGAKDGFGRTFQLIERDARNHQLFARVRSMSMGGGAAREKERSDEAASAGPAETAGGADGLASAAQEGERYPSAQGLQKEDGETPALNGAGEPESGAHLPHAASSNPASGSVKKLTFSASSGSAVKALLKRGLHAEEDEDFPEVHETPFYSAKAPLGAGESPTTAGASVAPPSASAASAACQCACCTEKRLRAVPPSDRGDASTPCASPPEPPRACRGCACCSPAPATAETAGALERGAQETEAGGGAKVGCPGAAGGMPEPDEPGGGEGAELREGAGREEKAAERKDISEGGAALASRGCQGAKAAETAVPPYCELAPLVTLAQSCDLERFEALMNRVLALYGSRTPTKLGKDRSQNSIGASSTASSSSACASSSSLPSSSPSSGVAGASAKASGSSASIPASLSPVTPGQSPS
ncbi:histidine acid phosphatase superfamily protein [Besnoitia besnoiti]|uniref:diphosphoinositol-pentakisphosphate 1-kinase n=1 Tax=Besnoitia besnoiti TaxID=94643 RepID=A0A2A9MDS0_BESBE|nr:histidine acid phosphatase superfamily protein [Besnoitia besnoiti]PFH36029.1 histidine acid phosphatase superfamily protein [Besnoitia besnoiti]